VVERKNIMSDETSERTISAVKLKELLDASGAATLFDVRPEDCFKAEHIPGARGACVYLIDFLDEVRAAQPDVAKTLVLYGNGEGCASASMAAYKLNRAGYRELFTFEGGVPGWKAEGFDVTNGVEAIGPAASGTILEGNLPIDPEASILEWTSRNLGGKHWGTMRITSGGLAFEKGALVSAEFVVDVNSVEAKDIEDPKMAAVLNDHLKSDDFFETERYPEASFQSTSVVAVPGAAPGNPNFNMRGLLTIKNVSNEVVFPCVVGSSGPNKAIARARFDIDRTRWNVIYGSGKFFLNLGMHLVNDIIEIEVKIVAERG
jgi:polyisoprenoid-binding protein YceI